MTVQNDSKIILTIGIPTWNRYTYLKNNVDKLISEISKIPDNTVEILISDNASADETQHYCTALSQQYSFVSYHRNANNLGANANFQNVIKSAKGKYVWLMGDDDAIVENCLPKLIHDFEKFNWPEIIIGGCTNDQTHERIYLNSIQEYLLTDQSLLQRYDAIKIAGKISVLVFKKTAVDSILLEAWDIISTTKTPWPHLVWVLLVLNQGSNILVLPYSTNYFLEESRYNMLQDGISRSQIMIGSYAELICSLKQTQLISDKFYTILSGSISANRQFEFLKIVAYSTYLNSYLATIQSAWRIFKALPGFYNRFNYAVFYMLPVLLPIAIRKCLLSIPLFFKWQAYDKFINYLKTTAVLLKKKKQSDRSVFNKSGL